MNLTPEIEPEHTKRDHAFILQTVYTFLIFRYRLGNCYYREDHVPTGVYKI